MPETDNNIRQLINTDKLSFEPDPAIEIRLLNHFNLKVGSSRPHQNMVLPFLTGFLSTKLLGLKIGIITTIVIAFVGFNQINYKTQKTITADTCSAFDKSDSVGYLKVMDSTSYN